MERVYWQEGDFVTHLAGINDNRAALAQEILARSGFWPPPELDVSPAPLLKSPIATHRDGLGLPFAPAKSHVLNVRRGNYSLQESTHILVSGITVPVTRYGARAYSHSGNALESKRDEDEEDHAIFRNDDDQWADVIAVRNSLSGAHSASNKSDEWLVVTSTLEEASQFVAHVLKAKVDDAARDAHVVVSDDNYGTPWLVRASEFSRNLFLRLRDGNLLRSARRRVMQLSDGDDEEWGVTCPEGLKALVERNPHSVRPWVIVARGGQPRD